MAEPEANKPLGISVSSNSEASIVSVLQQGLEINHVGERLPEYLQQHWSFDDFVHPDTHRNTTFFEELRNTLRDHGMTCFNPSLAQNLAIGIKAVQFVWPELTEAKIKDFRDAIAQAKRERSAPQSRNPSRATSPTRAAHENAGQPLDHVALNNFTTGMFALLKSLEASCNLTPQHTANEQWRDTQQAHPSYPTQDVRRYSEQRDGTNPSQQPTVPVPPPQQANQSVPYHLRIHNQQPPQEVTYGMQNDSRAFTPEEFKFQLATRQVLDYYHKKPQFTSAIDEDWQRHLRQFLAVCQAYKTSDEDQARLFGHSLQPSSAAHQLLETILDSSDPSWTNIVNKFTSRFYNAATRERVLNRLNSLSISSFRKRDDVDDNNALKSLVSEMDRLCGMVLCEDRTQHSKRRYLQSAFLGTEWAHHARSKVRSSEDLGEMIEILHESIDYITQLHRSKSNKTHSDNANRPSSVLFGNADSTDEDSDEVDCADDDKILFERMYTKHPRHARYSRFANNGFGRNSKHDSKPRRNQQRGNNKSRSDASALACFNCLKPSCRISVCPMPKDATRIRANLAMRRSMRGARYPHNNHIVDVHLFDAEDIYEISVAEAFVNATQEALPQSAGAIVPSPHTAFYNTTPQAPTQQAQTQTSSGANAYTGTNGIHLEFNPNISTASQLPTGASATPNTANLENHFFSASDFDDIGYTDRVSTKPNAVKTCTIPSDTVYATSSNRFVGFCLDSGAASSVVGKQQFELFQAVKRQPLEKVKAVTGFRFGNTIADTTERFKIRVPLSKDTYIFVYATVVPLSIPFLIGLEVFIQYGLSLDFYKCELRCQNTNIAIPITVFNKHAYVHAQPLDAKEQQYMILFSRTELERLHWHFYHPTPTQLYQLIRPAKPSEANAETKRMLDQISADCELCNEFHSSPLRFRVAMPPSEITFNSDVAIDLMWLSQKPVLHAVDLQTRFQNACFLDSGKSASEIWDKFVSIWVCTYTGFPSTLHLDQDTSFMSNEFIANCEDQGIELSVSGIESHNSLGAGEAYHRQLRRVYNCVQRTHPNVSNEDTLRLSIKAINDTVGANGITPSMLVFGTVPAFPAAPRNNATQNERFNALRTARDEMATITAEKRLNEALRRKVPPATCYELNPGDSVRVFREKSRAWDGPFVITKIDRKLVTVTDGVKAKTFNVSQVLPVQPRVRDPQTKRCLQRIFDEAIHSVSVLQSTDPRYASQRSKEAIRQEIQGLEMRGVFKLVREDDIPDGANVLNGRFILAVKDEGTPDERYKAGFVVQGHRDRDKPYIIHEAVPVKIRSVRILLILAIIFDFEVWLEDTNQRTRKGIPLKRAVYVRADANFGYSDGTFLLLLLPLYGLSEAGDAWNQRLTDFFKSVIGAAPTTTDRSLYYFRPEPTRLLLGIIAIYVDDCVYAGTNGFAKHTTQVREQFDSKPRKSPTFQFSGMMVERPERDLFRMHQHVYLCKLKQLPPTASFEDFRTLRHRLAWTTNTRPDILAGVNILSQTTKATFGPKHITRISSLITHLHHHHDLTTNFVKLDKSSLRLVIYSDGSFGTNDDYSSQVGYVVLLADANGNANLVHYSSTKTKRIVRSVLGAETIALSMAADAGISIAHDLKEMTGTRPPIYLLTDSETLFSVLIKSTTTTELRLMIDISAARQAFNNHEIATISWTRRNQNISDAMTKLAMNNSFVEFMRTNKLTYNVDRSVKRIHPKGQADTTTPLAYSNDPINDHKQYLISHAQQGVNDNDSGDKAKKGGSFRQGNSPEFLHECHL